MRSIPLALTWEMLHRGRWSLIGAALGAMVFPSILFTALRSEGALDFDDPAFLIMQVVLIQMNLFIFGAGVMAAQGSPSRLYAYPAATSTLVAWHLLPGMAIAALECLASTAALNAVFGLNWPLWGPALFVAAALAAIQAAMWLTEKSAYTPLAVAVAGAGLGMWFKSRYGDPFSTPNHVWREVTAAEVLTLAVVAFAAYGVGVAAVARNRRGEPPISLGMIAVLERVFTTRQGLAPAFRTPAQAQFWFEWRQKGWAMPTIVGFGMFLGMSGWLLFSRDPAALWEGFISGGGLLSLAGLIGAVIMGAVGPSDAVSEMGPFLGTRPMTTSDLARTILKVAAASVLSAWAIWAAAFLCVYLLLLATGTLPRFETDEIGWYFPATLLGPWMVVGVGASAGLTGRPLLFVKLLCGLIAAYVAVTLFSRYALSAQAEERLLRGAAMAAGAAFVCGTAWVFAAALRRALIERETATLAAIAWAALGLAAVAGAARHAPEPLPSAVFLVGLAALTVAPVAAAPLALAWNRNR